MACCTIEKANVAINKLAQEGRLGEPGPGRPALSNQLKVEAAIVWAGWKGHLDASVCVAQLCLSEILLITFPCWSLLPCLCRRAVLCGGGRAAHGGCRPCWPALWIVA